jgi:hypothetical protein
VPLFRGEICRFRKCIFRDDLFRKFRRKESEQGALGLGAMQELLQGAVLGSRCEATENLRSFAGSLRGVYHELMEFVQDGGRTLLFRCSIDVCRTEVGDFTGFPGRKDRRGFCYDFPFTFRRNRNQPSDVFCVGKRNGYVGGIDPR